MLCEEYEKSKTNTAFFNKRKLKTEYEQNQTATEKKYRQFITEMKNFEKLVEKVDPKNIMIFAAEAIYNLEWSRSQDGKSWVLDKVTFSGKFDKPTFSVPKNALIQDDIANASFSPILSLAQR